MIGSSIDAPWNQNVDVPGAPAHPVQVAVIFCMIVTAHPRFVLLTRGLPASLEEPAVQLVETSHRAAQRVSPGIGHL
jgi:hypothetical protein